MRLTQTLVSAGVLCMMACPPMSGETEADTGFTTATASNSSNSGTTTNTSGDSETSTGTETGETTAVTTTATTAATTAATTSTTGTTAATTAATTTAATTAATTGTTGTTTGGDPNALPYPERTAFDLKSLQPDFWPDHDEISNNDAGGVAFNFVWQQWEPEVKLAPCSDSEMEYDDHCFVVPAIYDENIADWTSRGLTVTAVVYGVPAWARQEPCSPAAAGFEIFCAPKNPEDYARFVGMIARRYDGNHDVGRVPDFVIHNEVNSNTWYDIGCGQGLGACDTGEWLDSYADNWNAAYDRVQVEQPHAKVFISLEHHFDEQYDQPDADNPLLSVRTFLSGFASRVGNRTWRVAFHPYPPDLFSSVFSADDLASEGKVTYGSVGGLQGWIYQKFGDIEAARDVHFTESGVNSSPPSTEAAQEAALCDSFRNILGTPGVHNHIYHRMSDNKNEGGLNLGLRRTDTSAKPAWSTWAMMNQDDSLDCGFEELPYTRLTRSFSQSRGHWASSRLAPAGFKAESSYRLLRAPEDGTHLLFECAISQHNMLTKDPGCEGQLPLGPVGYAWDAAGPNLVELFRCLAGTDHFISTDPGCEGQKVETSLGWVHT